VQSFGVRYCRKSKNSSATRVSSQESPTCGDQTLGSALLENFWRAAQLKTGWTRRRRPSDPRRPGATSELLYRALQPVCDQLLAACQRGQRRSAPALTRSRLRGLVNTQPTIAYVPGASSGALDWAGVKGGSSGALDAAGGSSDTHTGKGSSDVLIAASKEASEAFDC